MPVSLAPLRPQHALSTRRALPVSGRRVVTAAGMRLPADRCRTDPGAPRPAFEYSTAAMLAEAARGGPGQTAVLNALANRPDKLLAALHPDAAEPVPEQHLGCAIRALRHALVRPTFYGHWKERTQTVLEAARLLPSLPAGVKPDACNFIIDGLGERHRVRLTERGQHGRLVATLRDAVATLPAEPAFVRESIARRIDALVPPGPPRSRSRSAN